jgi:hypothetical protein
MHPSRIESKTTWKHTKVLTIKLVQDFINKDKKVYLYYVWHEIV